MKITLSTDMIDIMPYLVWLPMV